MWAWVAYEDDPSQGKDRPVLLVGRDGAELLCLQLTSKDHDRDAEDEARYGRYWMDVGTGDWDRERRAQRGPAGPAAAAARGRGAPRGCRDGPGDVRHRRRGGQGHRTL